MVQVMRPRSLLFVSQPRSGHHFFEDLLRENFADRLHYCEWYTNSSCCKSIPCIQSDRAGSPFWLVAQKSHDFDLSVPEHPNADIVVVQYRQSIDRAVSNYELDLKNRRLEHSRRYLKFWLALEAHYIVRFTKKWINKKAAGRLLLRYEDLTSAPVECLEDVLRKAGCRRALSLRAPPIKALRRACDSPFYEADLFGQFAFILARCACYVGHGGQTTAEISRGDVITIYSAWRAYKSGRFDLATRLLDDLCSSGASHPGVDCLYARCLAELGKRDAALRVLSQSMATKGHWSECERALRAIEGIHSSSLD